MVMMMSRALLGAMATLGFRLSLLLLLLSAVGYVGAAGACSSVAFSSNRVYAACSDLPRLSSSLHWSYDSASATLSLAFVAPPAKPEGWVAWAINPTGDGMIGSQALIAFHQSDGAMVVQTYNITGYGSISKGPIDFETWDLAAESSGGVTRIYGKMKLAAGTTVVKQVWQVGSAVVNGVPQKHDLQPDNLQSKGTVDLIKGEVSLSGGTTTRKRNVSQIFANLLTISLKDPSLLAGRQLTYIKVLALFMRPSKDNKYRFYWNTYHYLVGYTVIVLGIVNVFKGLKILSIDHKWTVGYIIAICILGGIALFLELVTWLLVVLKRNSENPAKPFDGSNSNGVQHPLSV
ncbi:hypothetical protein BHM03_00033551 [Ensete ventricosum]|nr:hypothetical protein BHM03_00033551 [Ensete ventricosum]